MLDSISLGNTYRLSANVNPVAGSCLFEKSPEADITNALYGQFSGLLVKTGSSVYNSNQSKLKLSLRMHGHSPLVLVDGLPRELDDLTGLEIDNISILKDAAAAALYGVKGGNGVVMITTRRGKDSPLRLRQAVAPYPRLALPVDDILIAAGFVTAVFLANEAQVGRCPQRADARALRQTQTRRMRKQRSNTEKYQLLFECVS